MAGLFDSQPVVNIGTVQTQIYAPAVDGVAMSCLITNTNYATLPVSVWIDRGGIIIDLTKGGLRIDAGESKDVLNGSKVAIKAGDIVYARCPIANVLTGLLSAYKDS